MDAQQSSPDRYWPAVMAAFGAMLVGLGLARFAYTPLLPAVIAEGWFSTGQAAYLGAANLAGYLLGAMSGRRIATLAPTPVAARTLMLIAAASFLACAAPLSFSWFSLWRFVSGVAGGALMVIAAPRALRLVPHARRGLAGGVIFTGVGLGIAVSGLVVPALLRWGLSETWTALGLVMAAVTAATWRGWPADAVEVSAAPEEDQGRWPIAASAVVAVYGLIACGLVPHMVFLVDFVARGLHAGIAAGSSYWVVFGIGAALGPTLFGALGDRIGFSAALALALAIEVAGGALLLLPPSPTALFLSSLVVGAFVPGCVPLVLGRLREIFHHHGQQQLAWSRATIVFALCQAAAGYLLSAAYAHIGDYRILFAFGVAGFAGALALDLLGRLAFRRRAKTLV